MHNFQNELQSLGLEQYHTGEVIPMDLHAHQIIEDPRRCGRCGFGCGGFRCGGFRCGGFRCGGFGCAGLGLGLGLGFGLGALSCGGCGGCYGCYGCYGGIAFV